MVFIGSAVNTSIAYVHHRGWQFMRMKNKKSPAHFTVNGFKIVLFYICYKYNKYLEIFPDYCSIITGKTNGDEMKAKGQKSTCIV